MNKFLFLSVIIFMGGVREIAGKAYSCNEISSYPSQNCTFNKMVLTDVTEDYSFTSNFYASQIYVVRFVESRLFEVPKKLFQSFQNIQLLFLNLCQIETISRYSFENAGSIIYLNLTRNRITELNEAVFKGASKLRFLDLTKNQIHEIKEKAFYNIENLELLFLTNNLIKSLPDNVFAPLTNLKKISLGNNNLEVLDAGLFEKCTKLESVYLHNNSIMLIDPNFFSNLPKLNIVYISSNQLHQIELQNINAAQVYISSNKLESIKINSNIVKLHAENNEISEVLIDGDSPLLLEKLVLSKNKISDLTFLSKMESLEILDLAFNKIGPLNLTTFSKLSNLQDLDLEATEISMLEHGTFSQQQQLLRLDISYNNFRKLDLDIFTSSNLLNLLFIDGNKLKEIRHDHIIEVFPNLKQISLSDNDWNCTYLTQVYRTLSKSGVIIENVNKTSITNQTNVKGIYCYDNGATSSWKDPVKHLDKFTNLLSTNEIVFEEIKQTMDELVGHITEFNQNKNEMSNKTEMLEKDISDMQSRIIRLDNDVYTVKKDVIDIKLSLLSNNTNQTYQMKDLKNMIQDLNNLTLGKQQLNNDALSQKLYEQKFEIEKLSEKLKEDSKRWQNAMKNVDNTQYGYQKQEPPTQTSDGGNSQIVLIVLVLIVVLINSGAILFVFIQRRNASNNVQQMRHMSRSTLSPLISNEI